MDERGSAVRTAAGFILMILLLCAVCALTAGIWHFMAGENRTKEISAVYKQRPVIVIDAGHGGMDSGAIGVSGVLEKEINLAVAKKLKALFSLSDVQVVMTREEDRMLVDDSVKTKRKMQDLKNRLAAAAAAAESGREVILVSIHMNNFTESRYSGLQVWYSAGDARSQGLAATVQSYARSFLDPSNAREIKQGTSAIYLLDRASFPAVLIEGGFLSNPEECARLTQDAYQSELAVTIFAAVMEYLRNF